MDAEEEESNSQYGLWWEHENTLLSQKKNSHAPEVQTVA
jgi:hypothetical protein